MCNLAGEKDTVWFRKGGTESETDEKGTRSNDKTHTQYALYMRT